MIKTEVILSVTREEYQSLRKEWEYLCDLARQASELWNALDFREGIAFVDGNKKHIEQCARLKAKARRRAHRRSGKAAEVYEEMDQESVDMASLMRVPRIRFAAA